MAAAPSSFSRTPTIELDAEGRTAATGGLHVRIIELEACTLEAFDVIDLDANQVHEAHLVHDDLHAGELDGAVDLGALVEVEVIREPGAPAADHAEAEGHVRLDALGLADLVDLLRGDRGDLHHRLRTGCVQTRVIVGL